MLSKTCSARDIFEINAEKEYTLIATQLLETVLTDSRLNAQTTKLWQLLFSKSRFHSNLEIKISYNYLADKLNRSARTISRYVDTLVNTGYLVIKHNYDESGAQRPNTIFVRVPELLVEQLKAKKNRYSKENSLATDLVSTKGLQDNENILKSKEIAQENNPATIQPKEIPKNETPEISSDIIYTSAETVRNSQSTQPINANDLTIQTVGIIASNSVITQESIKTNKACDTNSHDNIDRGGDDTSVIHKAIKEKDIKNNNNSVVVSVTEKKATDQTILQQQIQELEQLLAAETKELDKLKDHNLRYDQIKKTRTIAGQLHVATLALEQRKKQIQAAAETKQNQMKINSDTQLMFQKSGDRPVSPFTFKRLVESLKSYGYSDNTLNCLTNEIIFEARFGSLANCNKSKSPLSLDNAINIGLKLVREKRWSTPALLQKEYM